jgi:hypothetical protein
MSDPPARSATTHTALLLTAYGLFGILYIVRTSVVIDGTRYFTLVDDQMISMRYADNLAHGAGLVWNAGGERIEGFTNLAWVFYMAIYHVLGIARPHIALAIQVTGLLIALGNLMLVQALTRRVTGEERSDAPLMAALLTAFYLPLNDWVLQGTEVSLLMLATTAGAMFAVSPPRSAAARLGAYVALAATTLVRPDMLVTAMAIVAWVALSDRSQRTIDVAGAGVIVGVVLLETAWRKSYFGDLLPNTYYLKMTGYPLLPRVTTGAVAAIFLLAELVLVVLLAGMALGRRRSSARQLIGLLWLFAVQLAYSVFVGGDAWEWLGGSNRFVSIAVPALFVVAAVGFDDVLQRAGWRTSGKVLAGILLVVACDVLAYGREPATILNRLTMITGPFENDKDRAHLQAALRVRSTTSPDAVIAVVWAGVIPYFAERRAVDLLGKMDRYIARLPAHRPPGVFLWSGFYPGHLKWDYNYSLGTFHPDVVQAPLWHPFEREELTPHGYTLSADGQWLLREN